MENKLGLCSLPAELQNLIIPLLHPSAAIALRQTCRWYHDYVSLHRLDHNLVRGYLHDLELLPCNGNNYACFVCLSLKPITSFTAQHVEGKNRRQRGYSTKRSFLECAVKLGQIKPGRLLYIAKGKCGERTCTRVCAGCKATEPGTECVDSTPAVMCGGCLTIQTYFCGDCYWCMGCIMKARTWIGRGMARKNVSMAVDVKLAWYV